MEFLNVIKIHVEMCSDKKDKKKILDDYDNKDYFMLKLNEKLDGSVQRYMNMVSDEDEDDSED